MLSLKPIYSVEWWTRKWFRVAFSGFFILFSGGTLLEASKGLDLMNESRSLEKSKVYGFGVSCQCRSLATYSLRIDMYIGFRFNNQRHIS